MADEDEVIDFEVTDYDLQSEFNPMARRGKQSKKDQIYGIWADEVDDDSDGEMKRPSFGSSGKRYENTSSMGGVSFVSAGIQKSQKEQEQDAKDDPGEGTSKKVDSDSSSEDDVQFITTGVKGGGKKFQYDQMAGMRKANALGKGMDIYGIGAKMALKMGFQPGKGLGKDQQGIIAPIEAKVRKGRGAIGAYGKEISNKIGKATIHDPASDATNLQKKEKEKAAQKWQKQTGPGVKEKQKIEYKLLTVDQVLEKKNFMVRPTGGALSKTKVIDMTGPEERVLSGYHAISGGQQRPKDELDIEMEEEKKGDPTVPKLPESVFELPELLHNICLLEDSCEQDIVRNDRKCRYALDRKQALIEEREKLSQKVEKQEKSIDKLETLLIEIQDLTKEYDIDDALVTFAKLQKDYEEEWELYELYLLAPGIIIPLLQKKLKVWNPLTDPRLPISNFMEWASVLNNRTEQFQTVLWEVLMPHIRAASTNWNVKEPDPMLNLLEAWKLLIPNWMMTNMLDQLILPKITHSVEEWDPLSDPIPIHGWIHPWLPLLGAKLDMVYPTIRRKLSSALQKWHPSDSSGKDILTPWLNVFTRGATDSFILKNIIPKLQMVLSDELIFNPHNQDLGPWNWVMNWNDMIPPKAMVAILESGFFPKWIQFLVGWLIQRPNFDLVYQWYTWWRGMFPPTLITDPTIMSNIQKALEIISKAVQCSSQQALDVNYLLGNPLQAQPPQPQPPPLPVDPQQMYQQQQAFNMLIPPGLSTQSQVNLSFRDLVQVKCEELGLLFIPIPNKFYEGKQVYRVGTNTLIYISSNVLYAINNATPGLPWQPISINQLLQMASN